MATLSLHTNNPARTRINVSLPCDVVRSMTLTAAHLDCSRSSLIEYCYRLFLTLNPDVAQAVSDSQEFVGVTLPDE